MGSLYHRDESRGWPGVRGARGVARDGWVSLKEDWYFVSHPWTSDDRESQSSKKRNDKTRVRSREMEHLIFAPPLSPLSWLIYSMQFYAVLMFHSTKNPADPSSYRGISLSSNLSKVFEHALLPHLLSKLLPLIHPLQGGFRPGFLYILSPLVRYSPHSRRQ